MTFWDRYNEKNQGFRAAFGNLLSSFGRSHSPVSSPIGFDQAQGLLDRLEGTGADFGFFYSYSNKRVYCCSVRLMNGDLAYGTGPTLEAAYKASQANAPIRAKRESVA